MKQQYRLTSLSCFSPADIGHDGFGVRLKRLGGRGEGSNGGELIFKIQNNV
jgi:hypothetical protein